MKLSKIKRNTNAAENGAWVIGAIGNIDLLIAATGNEKYTELMRKLMKPYQRNYKTMADSVFINMQNECLSKTILLGWRNMEAEDSTDENPKFIEYSQKTAYELLKDPENHVFRETVIALADEEEVFKKELVEDTTFQAQ